MARFFDERTSIIHQNPVSVGYKVKRQNRRWILLPMIAHKVLVPYPKDRELNVFQETVLKLFRNGYKTPAYIAEKLLLNEELVTYVVDELKLNGLITDRCVLTEQGTAVLNDQFDTSELKTGYVFYDLVTGAFWDSFIFSEEFQTVQNLSFGENNRSFLFGNVGNPERERAIVVKGGLNELNDLSATVPDNLEILKICMRHKRRMSGFERFDRENDGQEPRLPRNLSKVKFLGDSMPVLAATFLFIPNDLGAQAYWQVCHPFGGGVSRRLRESLDKLKDEAGSGSLKEEIRRLTEEAYRVSEVELEARGTKEEKEAGIHLTEVFSPEIRKYEALYGQLVELFALSKSLSAMNANAAKHYETIQTKLKAYIDAVYTLMAEVLYSLKNGYMDYFKIGYLTLDSKRNAETLSVIAKRIGFQDREPGGVFSKMLEVKRGAVAHVDSGKDIKSLLAVNLLIADQFDEHPFWKLAKRVPQFILFLEDLRAKRNTVDHPTDESYLYSAVEVMMPRVMYLISILFEGLQFNYTLENRKQILFNDDEEDALAAEADMKRFRLAETRVEDRVGLIVREFEQVRKALVDVLYVKETGEGKFLVNCSKVLEDLCGLWANKELDFKAAGLVNADNKKNISYLSAGLKQYGYAFDSSRLPASFLNITPDKVKKTFSRFDRGTLNTQLYAILFSGLKHHSKVLEDIGLEASSFVEFCARISDLRGHGTLPEPVDLPKDELADRLVELTKAMLGIFRRHQIASSY